LGTAAAADACASGDSTQIGGYVQSEDGQCKWFSLKLHHNDFAEMGICLEADLQRSITCMETLAQIGILFLTARFFYFARMPIRLTSLSDNTGAEASSNKLFCTSKPLCLFVEKLCIFFSMSGIEMDVSHIPAKENVEADLLSRWDFASPIPCGFVSSNRVEFTLQDLWTGRPKPSLHPPLASLPWNPPG